VRRRPGAELDATHADVATRDRPQRQHDTAGGALIPLEIEPVRADLASAQRELEQAIAEAASGDPWLAEHPPRVTWIGGRFAPAETPLSHPLIDLLGGCVADVQGDRPAIEGAAYGSDLRHFVNEAHMPAVLFGPGGARTAHMPDEFVSVAQVAAVARSLALLIVRFCGIE